MNFWRSRQSRDFDGVVGFVELMVVVNVRSSSACLCVMVSARGMRVRVGDPRRECVLGVGVSGLGLLLRRR